MSSHAAHAVRAVLYGSVLVALAACHHGDEDSDAAGPTPQVVVETLKSAPVTLKRELAGRVQPTVIAQVRPRVSGIVKKLLFSEGGFVKAGQALYELDDGLFRAQLQSTQASLHRAEATYAAAHQAADRSRALLQIQAASAQDQETAVMAEAQAKADIEVARAAVDTAELNLSYARVIAPISGIVSKSAVTQGALVTAEQSEALATIQQLDPIYVEVNQPSSNWLMLKRAMENGRVQSADGHADVDLILEDGERYPMPGRLQFAEVTVDTATGNFLLRALVPNPNRLLLPGMYVRAEVEEGTIPQAILAPQQAITRTPKGDARALVVGADDTVEARSVHVSRTIGDRWLVDDGLVAGERVIVEGSQRAAPGTKVQISPPAATVPAATAAVTAAVTGR